MKNPAAAKKREKYTSTQQQQNLHATKSNFIKCQTFTNTFDSVILLSLTLEELPENSLFCFGKNPQIKHSFFKLI